MKFKKLSILGIALTSTMLFPTSVDATSYYSNSAYAEAFSKHYGNMCVITIDQEPNNPDVKWAQKASDYRSSDNSPGHRADHVAWADIPGMPSDTQFGYWDSSSNTRPGAVVEDTINSPGHDNSWKNVAKRGATMALGVKQTNNGTFIQGRIIEPDGGAYDGQQTYTGSNCAGNVEKWKNNGSAKTTTSGKAHKPNSTYYVNLKQPQKSSTGKTREIFKNYKVYKYDTNGHTTYYKNSDYDANGKETNTTIREYKYNPITKKSVQSKVRYYKNGKLTKTDVTPTTWTTKKTYSKVTGKTNKHGSYSKNTYKEQVSNFGSKRTIHTDGVKGTYGSNGKTKTWEHWYFDANGKEFKKSKYTYDSKGREINKTSWKNKSAGNKTRYKTEYKNTKYHTNGKVKSTSTYTYYKNSNTASKNVYNEFYSNGKPKLYKDTYYKTNGKVKEVRQSKFNSAGKRIKSVKKY